MGRLAYVQIQPAFRRDIQGMRALAVLVVLAYHAGVSAFGGGYVGVDVFFVLSGYLITGLLVRELDATGTINVLDFYAKRARRLLPASFTVLAAVGAVIYLTPRWIPDLVAPQFYGRSISWDIQRSALYIVNWLFAERSVEYQGGTELASPLQHFWSLSVEEQFYATWPLLLLGIVVASRWAKVSRWSKPILMGVIGVITVASLVMSYRLTKTAPEQAYFVTTTRVWELSLGGLTAIAAPRLDRFARSRGRAIQRWAGLVGTAGLAAVVFASVIFDDATRFPGLWALVPTVGTAAMLLALPHAGESVLVRTLSSEPAQWFGARSYSIYLWHWPALWIVTAVEGTLSPTAGVVVVVVSLLPAMASYRWIEQPARTATFLSARPLRGLALTGGAAIAGYAIGFVLLVTTTNVPQTDPPELANGIAAEITTEVAGIQLESSEIWPPIADARFDLPDGYDDGCISHRTETTLGTCSYGNVDSATTVLVIGNSHAGHWTPALANLASEHNWHLLTNIRSSCRLPAQVAGLAQCPEWAEGTMAGLAELVEEAGVDLILLMPNPFLGPDAVGIGIDSVAESELEAMYFDTYGSFAALPTRSAIISPTPRGAIVGVDCASPVRANLSNCAISRDLALQGTQAIVRAAQRSDLSVIDMNGYLCNDEVCPAVIDDMLVRRDREHLTRTFSEALTRPLGDKIERVAPEIFASSN